MGGESFLRTACAREATESAGTCRLMPRHGGLAAPAGQISIAVLWGEPPALPVARPSAALKWGRSSLDVFWPEDRHAAHLRHQRLIHVLEEGLTERQPDLLELVGAVLLARVVEPEIRQILHRGGVCAVGDTKIVGAALRADAVHARILAGLMAATHAVHVAPQVVGPLHHDPRH